MNNRKEKETKQEIKTLKKEMKKLDQEKEKLEQNEINKADEDFDRFRNKMKSFYSSHTRVIMDNKMIPHYDSIIDSLSECYTLMEINAGETNNSEILTKWVKRLNEITELTDNADEEEKLYKSLKHEAVRCQKHLDGTHGGILRNLPSSVK